MKKKILLSILIVLTIFTITGCGTKNENKSIYSSNSNNSSDENKEK